MGMILGAAGLAAVLVAVFFFIRNRRRRAVQGAGLICVTPREFSLTPAAVKAAAERGLAGEPQFHPIVASQVDADSILLQVGPHPIFVGRTIAEDDEDRYGLALFYAADSSNLTPDEAYYLLGKLAAALAPEGATRLIAPHLGRETQLSPELLTAMAEEDFTVGLSFYGEPWLVQIDGEGAEMKAAVEQARNRWPEFVEAFRNREATPEANFAVKMPLVFAGQTEFIWIDVQAVDDHDIRGVLANDSMHDRSVKAGHPVTAPVSDLNDWMILRGDDMTGGFTVPILMKQGQ